MADFSALDAHIKASAYAEVVNDADEILKASHDNDALACKAVALMHLGRYEEASKIAAGDQLAYCLYKLKRYDEALAKTSSPLLRAQALFKLGRFKESAQIYEREGGAENDELSSNLCAALLGFDPDAALALLSERKGAQSDTYEFAFNGGCAAIEKQDWKLAAHLLATSFDTASTIMEQEGFSDAEKASEMSLILTQQGFVAQAQGLRDEAVKRYLQVVDMKGADKTAVAVASANLAGLQEQHGLFDALKRLERARQNDVMELLSNEQRSAVLRALATVLLRLKRPDDARRALEEALAAAEQRGEGSGTIAAALAALLPREQGLQLLDRQSKLYEKASGNLVKEREGALVAAARGRLLFEGGDGMAAVAAIRAARESGAGARLLMQVLSQGPSEVALAAEQALREAATRSGSLLSGRERGLALLATARARAERGEWRGASEDCEAGLRCDKSSRDLLALHVLALGRSDPAAADALAAALPGPTPVSEGDAEAAEIRLLAGDSAPLVAVAVASSVAAEKKTNVAAAVTEGAKEEGEKEKGEERRARARKSRRKKKKRLPKDLEKPIDPERWLPMKQRSYYIAPIKKAVRGKKSAARGGHQGGTASAEVVAALDAAAKSKSAAASPPAKTNPRRKK